MSSFSKYSNRTFKLGLVLLFGYMIYRQVIKKEEIDDIIALFRESLSGQNFKYLLLCIFLMPINWLFESLKWNALVNDFQKMSWLKSYQAILAGLSMGIVTPQRIGEYGGRILILEKENRIKGVLSTFLCSLFQNIINVLMGLIGVFFLNAQLNLVEQFWIILLVALVVFAFALLYILYRNTQYVKILLEKLKVPSRIKTWIYKLVYFKQVPLSRHIQLFFLSFFRYSIYLFQYLLILKFFGINISFSQGFNGVSTIYLIQSGIPLPPVLDIAARAEIAYLIWGQYSENILGILSATFGLWGINLILPSFFGLFFVFKAEIFESHETK